PLRSGRSAAFLGHQGRCSSYQKGNFHGYSVGWAVHLAREAIPAVVIFHVRLARGWMDGEAVHRTGLHADVTALDTSLLIHYDRHIEEPCDLAVGHGFRRRGSFGFRGKFQPSGDNRFRAHAAIVSMRNRW